MSDKNSDKQLKVLFLDIETTPNLGYCWGKYEQNIIQFEKESHMLCFTAKWLGSNKTIIYGLPDFPDYEKNKESDKELVRKLWDLLDEADIVVAHNGDSFDIKKTNARLVVNGLNPPSPYRTVDTKKVAKKHFMFNSNSLNDLGQLLGLGKKLPTGGFKLWLDCMAGDLNAWKKMKSYNKQDVLLLEKVYLKLRSWTKNHPNVGVNISKETCHICGSSNIQKRGFNYCKVTKYQRYHCKSCGGWSQGSIEKIVYE
jgi:hypothetical protein